MHTLRYVIGDSIFFPALKEFVTSPAYTYDNLVTTDDVEQFFSRKSNINLKPLFDLFLRTTQKPEVYVKQMPNEVYQVSLTNIDMSLPVKIITSEKEQTISIGKKPVTVKSSTMPVIDPDRFYLTRVVSE
jgi:hypothetical protein